MTQVTQCLVSIVPLAMFSPHILIFLCVRLSCDGLLGLATFFKLDKDFFLPLFFAWALFVYGSVDFPTLKTFNLFSHSFVSLRKVLMWRLTESRSIFLPHSLHWPRIYSLSSFIRWAVSFFPPQIFLYHTFSTFRAFNNNQGTFWKEFMNFCLILTVFCFFVYNSHVAFDWISPQILATFFTLAKDLFSLFTWDQNMHQEKKNSLW